MSWWRVICQPHWGDDDGDDGDDDDDDEDDDDDDDDGDDGGARSAGHTQVRSHKSVSRYRNTRKDTQCTNANQIKPQSTHQAINQKVRGSRLPPTQHHLAQGWSAGDKKKDNNVSW